MRAVLLAIAAAALHAVGTEAARSEKVVATSQSASKESGGLRPGGIAHGKRERHAGAKHRAAAAHAPRAAGARQRLRTKAAGAGSIAAPTAAPVIVASAAEEQGEVAAGLKRELKEVEQSRANIRELQQALASQVALLRESTALERASTSARGRAAATRQVRKSEQLVKDTSAMLKESREDAADSARAVLRETAEVRTMLNTLSTEARGALQSFAAAHARDDGAAEERSAPQPSNLAALGANESQAQLDRAQDLDIDDPEDDVDA